MRPSEKVQRGAEIARRSRESRLKFERLAIAAGGFFMVLVLPAHIAEVVIGIGMHSVEFNDCLIGDCRGVAIAKLVIRACKQVPGVDIVVLGAHKLLEKVSCRRRAAAAKQGERFSDARRDVSNARADAARAGPG